MSHAFDDVAINGAPNAKREKEIGSGLEKTVLNLSPVIP
jgi:hypothetical protein